MKKLKNTKWGIIALFLLGGLFVLSAHLEGYFDPIVKSDKFLLFFAVVLIICLLTSLNVNSNFFVWLLILSFFIGLITQIIGTFNNLWIYKGTYKSYVFAGFLWAFSAATMLGLSLAINKLFPKIDRKLYNVLCLMVLFLIIPIFLGKLRTGMNLNFWIYYFSLFVFVVVATYRLKFSVLLSLVLAAWIMGYVNEYMGSKIGLWRFCATPEGSETARSIACWSPPPYLTFGCWPLIFLTQMGLSFFLSQEHLNMRSEDKANP
jgi:hypothetical protein